MKAVFDTNILIDYLNGHVEARDEFLRYGHRAISLVTWMEVLIGCADEDEERVVRAFLGDFVTHDIDPEIAERAVILRRHGRMRSPDAVIQATAEVNHALLVTRNTKDFDADSPGVRVPYSL